MENAREKGRKESEKIGNAACPVCCKKFQSASAMNQHLNDKRDEAHTSYCARKDKQDAGAAGLHLEGQADKAERGPSSMQALLAARDTGNSDDDVIITAVTHVNDPIAFIDLLDVDHDAFIDSVLSRGLVIVGHRTAVWVLRKNSSRQWSMLLFCSFCFGLDIFLVLLYVLVVCDNAADADCAVVASVVASLDVVLTAFV